MLAFLGPLIALAGSWFMDAGPRVTGAMHLYIGIRMLAAPFSLINYAVLGYVLGRGQGGLGLGLYLAKRIAELHGGDIAAESMPGKGARFILTLPVAPGSAAARPRAPSVCLQDTTIP